MTVVCGFDLAVDLDGVLVGQGCHPSMVRARGGQVLEAAERALAEGGPLAAPAVVTAEREVRAFAGDSVALEGGAFTGRLPARVLGRARAVVVGVATIGPSVEERVTSMLGPDPLGALALDGYGNAALSALARIVCDRVAAGADARGWQATPPVGPGLAGWPLDPGQRELFALVDAAAIGVALTGSSLMVPQKSLSFAVGIGPGVEVDGQACDWCGMRPRCRFRRRD